MPSQAFSGTETIGTTEWSLTTDTSGPDAETTAGTYQAFVDASALTAADLYLLRIYEKTTGSGDTQRLFGSFTIRGGGDPGFITAALILLHGWDMTLQKLAGTDRSITWSIRTP